MRRKALIRTLALLGVIAIVAGALLPVLSGF